MCVPHQVDQSPIKYQINTVVSASHDTDDCADSFSNEGNCSMKSHYGKDCRVTSKICNSHLLNNNYEDAEISKLRVFSKNPAVSNAIVCEPKRIARRAAVKDRLSEKGNHSQRVRVQQKNTYSEAKSVSESNKKVKIKNTKSKSCENCERNLTSSELMPSVNLVSKADQSQNKTTASTMVNVSSKAVGSIRTKSFYDNLSTGLSAGCSETFGKKILSQGRCCCASVNGSGQVVEWSRRLLLVQQNQQLKDSTAGFGPVDHWQGSQQVTTT